MNKNKICIIGDPDSILEFKSFGIEIFPVGNAKEAANLLANLSRNGYAVIFIIESLAAQIPDEIAKYTDAYLPAVVPVPGISGSMGFGLGNMKKWVEKAIGADILFREG